MSKSKLDSIKGLYRAQERALGRELQRAVSEREQHRQQQRELDGLLAQYRDQHTQAGSLSADQALRFQRFYKQLVSTLTLQGELTHRLAQAEDIQRNAWRLAYQRRLGIERVIDKQAAEAAAVARRRERRARAPLSDPWSTLNKDL